MTWKGQRHADLIFEFVSCEREETFSFCFIKPQIPYFIGMEETPNKNCTLTISGDEPNETPCRDLGKCGMNKDY